jgi:hypothetical protein
MGRAFSPCAITVAGGPGAPGTSGVARGWYECALSALSSDVGMPNTAALALSSRMGLRPERRGGLILQFARPLARLLPEPAVAENLNRQDLEDREGPPPEVPRGHTDVRRATAKSRSNGAAPDRSRDQAQRF